MQRRTRFACLVSLFLLLALAFLGALGAPPVLAAAGKPPSTDALIERAQAAAANGTAEPARDLAPLVERLATTHDGSDQHSLIIAVEALGRHDSANPAAVKAYLLEAAPPALLAVARGRTDTYVRQDALMALRTLNVDDRVLDEAIALADADTSPGQDQIRFAGRLLADWKSSRRSAGAAPAATSPATPAKEQAALAFLRRNHESVSADNLGQAALAANTAVVVALLDAGVDVNAKLGGGLTPLGYVATGCVGSEATDEARLATIDALVERGADVHWQDGGGNTLLMHAVQCPAPVVAKLIAAGAAANAVNAQGFSPLLMAFASGKWEVAELLVAHGARASKRAIDKVFFELPTDPKKLALIRRATAR